MKTQNKNSTPVSSPTKKEIRTRNIGHYSSDFSFKKKQKFPSRTTFVEFTDTNDEDENEKNIKLSTIQSTSEKSKDKIHKSTVNLRNQKYGPKPLLKSKSCILPSIKNTQYLDDLQISKSPSNKIYDDYEFYKEYIESHFKNADDEINLQQLENYLKYFSIIKKDIDDDPLLTLYLLPYIQKKTTKYEKVYDTQKLKKALIKSFKMSDNLFCSKLANCIKYSIHKANKKIKTAKINTKNIIQYSSNDFSCYLNANSINFTQNDNRPNNDSNNDSKNENQNPIKVITNIGKVTEENFNEQKTADSNSTEHKEKSKIDRIISRMQTIDKNKPIKFKEQEKNQNDEIIKNKTLLQTDKTVFPIQEFINKASHLISLLITKATDNKNERKENNNYSSPYSLLSVNLLIDCSSKIPETNKMFNILLLTSFSYALNILKIPYEIGVVADSKFRFILKSFDEPHSIQGLQRVLDCILIKRYKTNYPDTFHHAIENMDCPDKTRTQRAIFLFSDGLDENITLIDAWNKQVLNNKSISFGIIATSPNALDKEKKNYMNEIWSQFAEGTKNALSINRIAVIDSNLNNKSNLTEIVNCFKDVISRPIEIQNNFKKPENQILNFDYIFSDLKNNELEIYESEINKEIKADFFIKIDKSVSILETTTIKNDENKKQILSHYLDKTPKIASCKIDQTFKSNFTGFIHRVLNKEKKNLQSQMEKIFKIEKQRKNQNYGITIVIDASISCFNFIGSFHSIKTVINVLCALSSVDIPYINIILATEKEPIVLCCDVSSIMALNEKSSVWPALFSYLLQNPLNDTNLESALQSAIDLHEMKSNNINYSSYLFVLTDGLFMVERKENIKQKVLESILLGINTIGIGIGMYPLGITDIFQKSVFSPNPDNAIKAISCCFSNEELPYLNDISPLLPDIEPSENIFDILNKTNEPVFKELKDVLNDIPASIDALDDLINPEKDIQTKDYKKTSNPTGKDTEMFIKNIFKGQKILIVMLYNCDLNLEENPNVNKEFLTKNPDKSKDECVKKAVEFYGIDIVIVEDYDSAISELMKRENNNNKCIYYATWIISGWKFNYVPNNSNAHHVIAFTQCLLKFWKSGGSIVLFAEGEPLTFQANYFLEQITFPDGSKTKLRLKGSHAGKQTLYGDDEGTLLKPSSFNRLPYKSKNYEHLSLSHNLYQIYEGETISYVECDPEIYKPFIPFSKDSEGGISALFYPFDADNNTGNIVIDCGYTKLFDKMTTNGTFRYIQNIAIWTGHIENSIYNDIEPKDYRPDGFSFNINEFINETYEFDEMPDDFCNEDFHFDLEVSQMKTLFAVDYSGSTYGESYYYDIVSDIFKEKYKEGDLIIVWGSYSEIINYDQMIEICDERNGCGGGTLPESIIDLILDNKPRITADHFVIITDGCINSDDVSNCIEKVESNQIKFKMVDTYIIGNGGDDSVGTVFKKESPCTTYTYKPDQDKPTIEVISKKDIRAYDRLNTIDTLSIFDEKFDSLFKVIKTKMMGKGANKDLENQLLEVKAKITERGESNPDFERKINALIKMSTGAIKNIFNNKDITAMLK